MSDTEGTKKSGYRLEYASSGRSKCNGPKPCKGTPIGKGELRFGSLVDFRGNTNFSWRHWGCVTTKIISNMKNSFDEADELDGFDDLNDEDQDRIKKAWEEGHVAAEDVPETARKADGEEAEDDDEEKPKKRGGKKKDDGGKGVFKFEYASSGRSKCKDCGENIGKDFFRFGQEGDFRGNKTVAWRHWGCSETKLVEKLKASYDEPSQVPGWGDLKEGEKEKVQRAWDEGAIPADDKGVGEAVDTGKKKPVPRKKKEENGEEKPKKARAPRKKKAEVEDEDDEMDDEEEPKPKKARGAAKAAPAAKAKAAPKKAAAKKKKEESESGEDFGDELAAVDDEEIDEDDEEPEENPKKRKRAPASKGAAKPPSKRAKPASSTKPPSKTKATSSRGKKKAEEPIEEADEDDYD